MKNIEALKETLHKALEMEEKGYKFYREQSDKVKNQLPRIHLIL